MNYIAASAGSHDFLPSLTVPVYFNSCCGWKTEHAESLIFLRQNPHIFPPFPGRPTELNYTVQLPYLYLRQAVLIFSVNQFELLTPQYGNYGTWCLDRSRLMSALELYTNELCHEHKPSETLCECQVLSNALLS